MHDDDNPCFLTRGVATSHQQRRLVYGLKALEEDRSLKVKTAFSRLLEGVPKQVTNNILRAILGDKMSCHVRPK